LRDIQAKIPKATIPAPNDMNRQKYIKAAADSWFASGEKDSCDWREQEMVSGSMMLKEIPIG